MAGKGFLFKYRPRMASGEEREKKKVKSSSEISKLEKIEQKMEKVSDKMMKGIEEIEEIKEIKEKKISGEFSFIKGGITTLFLQDIVGSAFGGVFFALTQEVWDISLKIRSINLFFIFLLSILMAFSLIYFSRRRKSLSMKLHITSFLRTTEIYISSYVVSILLLIIFGISTGFNSLLLKEAIIVTLPAVISAATADLLFF